MKIFLTLIKKNIIWILLILWFLIWLFRLWYFVYSDVPLGYDPGMYKEIFNSYIKVLSHFDLNLLPVRVRHEPLLWIIAASLHQMWISFDRLLTRGIWIINLLPWLLLFFYFKSNRKPEVGLLVALLYWTSIVQYEVFWWNYFKQAIAISFMIMILFLWEKKNLFFQSFLFFLLILLHRHTAIFTWIILAIWFLYQRIWTKKFPWKEILYLFISWILALLMYIPLWNRIMPEAIKAVGNSIWWESPWWDFINIFNYIKLQRPIIILSFRWLFIQIRKRKFDLWLIGYWLWVIWIVFSLVNFNRTIVFLDIFVILFAAYALIEIINISKNIWLKSVWILFVSIFCAWNAIYYLWYVADRNVPLINQEEYSSIKYLDYILEKNAIIMTTHRNYTPRIMWRSNRDYINPGMSDMDKRTHLNWNNRRLNDGKIKCEMLMNTYYSLHRPLYIWFWKNQFKENLYWWYCFKLISHWTSRQLYKVF
jgi:hypothetical protein